MKAQNKFYKPYAAAFKFTVVLLLSQIVLGREILDRAIEEEKRSELLSRRSLPKWLEELPSVPQWMKVAASKYRGLPDQISCAVTKMAKALNDMRDARAVNCDDYFRCRGSHEAAQCGDYAAAFASHVR